MRETGQGKADVPELTTTIAVVFVPTRDISYYATLDSFEWRCLAVF